MKNIQYKPVVKAAKEPADKNKDKEKSAPSQTPVELHNEDAISRLNAIAREYPFCVCYKQQNTFLL